MIASVLDLVNVNKSYGALQATKELSLSVERGQIHALIGPNGAGKTTTFYIFLAYHIKKYQVLK